MKTLVLWCMVGGWEGDLEGILDKRGQPNSQPVWKRERERWLIINSGDE